MTTNPPKAPYGHLPNGMPIDPGPEHELVGEDEIVTGEYQYTVDGIEWRNAWSCNHFTAKARCLDDWLAIRRRKVVKEQWPKYWEGSDFVRRALSPEDTGQFFSSIKGWRNYVACDPLITWIDKITGSDIKPCTPQRAFELTGDKSILGKEGDEKCHTSTNSPQVASSAPGETKGASLPQCECCGKENLSKGSDFTVCLYCLEAAQEYKTLQEDSRPRPSSPAWIPVSERLPKECVFVPVIVKGWSRITVAYREYGGGWRLCEEEKATKDWTVTHWYDLPVIPLPPKPKTQSERDEEAMLAACPERMIGSIEYETGFQKGLAYARGEKVKE